MFCLCAELVLGAPRVPERGCVGFRFWVEGSLLVLGSSFFVGAFDPERRTPNCRGERKAPRKRASQPKVCFAVGEGGKFGHEFERVGRVRCGLALGAWGGAGLLSAPARATTR